MCIDTTRGGPAVTLTYPGTLVEPFARKSRGAAGVEYLRCEFIRARPTFGEDTRRYVKGWSRGQKPIRAPSHAARAPASFPIHTMAHTRTHAHAHTHMHTRTYAHSRLCCVSLVYSWRQGLSQEREARVDAAMKTTRVQDPLEAHLSRFVYAGLQTAFEAALDASTRTADSIGKCRHSGLSHGWVEACTSMALVQNTCLRTTLWPDCRLTVPSSKMLWPT